MASKSQSTTTSTPELSEERTTNVAGPVTQPRGNQAAMTKLGEDAGESATDDTSMALQLDALECYDYPGAVDLALENAAQPAAKTWLQAQDPGAVVGAGDGFWQAFLRALPDGGSIEVGAKVEASLGLAGLKAATDRGLSATLSYMDGSIGLSAELSATATMGAKLELLSKIGVPELVGELSAGASVSMTWTLDDPKACLDGALDAAWNLVIGGGSPLSAMGAVASFLCKQPVASWRIEGQVGGAGKGLVNAPGGGGLETPLVDAGAQLALEHKLGAGAAVGHDEGGDYVEISVTSATAAQTRAAVADAYGLGRAFFSMLPPAATGLQARLRLYCTPDELEQDEPGGWAATLDVTHGGATDHIAVQNAAEAVDWVEAMSASWFGIGSTHTGEDGEERALPEGGLARSVSYVVEDAETLAPWVPELMHEVGNMTAGVEVLDNSLKTSMSTRIDATVRVDDLAVDTAAAGVDEAQGSSRFATASAIADAALGREVEATAADVDAGVTMATIAPATLTVTLAGEAKATKEALMAMAGNTAPLVEQAGRKVLGVEEAPTLSPDVQVGLDQCTTRTWDLARRVDVAELPDLLAAAAK